MSGSVNIARVEGPRLVLRLIEPEDADYVYGLRTDPRYNRHLSPVSGTVEDQRAWITAYKTREAEQTELYYVIERTDGVPCGLVRLYDIGDDSFTWGSWILDTGKPAKAALESTFLSMGIGFEGLGKTLAHIDVRRDNARAIAFYRRFGMTEAHRDEADLFFEYPRTRFERDAPEYRRILERVGQTT